MSDLITDEIFVDAQANIAASNMNGIIGRARVQPDMIGNKVQSSTVNVSDQLLILKTDNTLARALFSTIVNSTSSALPLADATKNGMLRQLSGVATDFVGGDNNCHPVSSILPSGIVCDYAGPNVPAGWFLCNGASLVRTTYPNLYAAIGTTYGAADGTHFSLPNYSGRILAAWGGSFGALGAVGGAATVALGIGNMPNHTHAIVDVAHTHGATSTDSGHVHGIAVMSGGGTWSPGTGWSQSAGNTNAASAVITTTIAASGTGLSTTQGVSGAASTAFGILPPFMVTYKIIKI